MKYIHGTYVTMGDACSGTHPVKEKEIMNAYEYDIRTRLQIMEEEQKYFDKLMGNKLEEQMMPTMINPCREIELPLTGLKMNLFGEEKVEDNTNWEFHSSAEEDINWKDIKNTLSYAEPLALVTRVYRDFVDATKYVVVSKALIKKAELTDWMDDMPVFMENPVKDVFEIDNNFSEWVEWAKLVKAESWPEPIKSTIKVILPTI